MLEDMTAIVFIENQLYEILISKIGMDSTLIHKGFGKYTYEQTIKIVNYLDSALRTCSKSLQKKILAQRMSFVFAFGPGMEEVCGPAPEF